MPETTPIAPTCPCGHAVGHPMVHAVPVYGPLAWIWLMAGAGVTPRRARYVCRRCNRTLAETRDPRVLASLR